MTRLLFWIALIILVVMAVRSKLRAAAAARGYHPQGGEAMPAGGTARPHPRVEESERMTSCAYCGIYFPASEAVHEGGHDYCSQAHARQPAASRPD
ncbi:MAG: PP0621 family protein [Telluria sp.]